MRKAPNQARSRATVEAIVHAGARVLADRGWAGFTTNRVAEVAGVSIGSLYQYFPGKEAILAELIRRKRAVMLAAFQAVAADHGLDLDAAIDGLVAAGIEQQMADPVLSLALDYAEATLPLQAETGDLKARMIAAVATVLARHGIADPGLAARDLVALARGMIDHAGLYGDQAPASLAARVRRAIRGYLFSPPDARP